MHSHPHVNLGTDMDALMWARFAARAPCATPRGASLRFALRSSLAFVAPVLQGFSRSATRCPTAQSSAEGEQTWAS